MKFCKSATSFGTFKSKAMFRNGCHGFISLSNCNETGQWRCWIECTEGYWDWIYLGVKCQFANFKESSHWKEAILPDGGACSSMHGSKHLKHFLLPVNIYQWASVVQGVSSKPSVELDRWDGLIISWVRMMAKQHQQCNPAEVKSVSCFISWQAARSFFTVMVFYRGKIATSQMSLSWIQELHEPFYQFFLPRFRFQDWLFGKKKKDVQKIISWALQRFLHFQICIKFLLLRVVVGDK